MEKHFARDTNLSRYSKHFYIYIYILCIMIESGYKFYRFQQQIKILITQMQDH